MWQAIEGRPAQPGGVRIGGRVPWGTEVEFVYTSGLRQPWRVFVNHIVDERGYGMMLNKPETDAG